MRTQETLQKMWERWHTLREASATIDSQLVELAHAFSDELTERGATAIAGICEFKQGKPTVFQDRLHALRECEAIPAEELAGAWTPPQLAGDLPADHVLKEGRWNMVKVKPLARKYGVVVQKIVDNATEPGRNMLVVVAKEKVKRLAWKEETDGSH